MSLVWTNSYYVTSNAHYLPLVDPFFTNKIVCKQICFLFVRNFFHFFYGNCNAPINLELQHLPPSPGQSPDIWTFEDWIIQILPPWAKLVFKCPNPTVGFVCPSAPVVFNLKLVYKHANTCLVTLHMMMPLTKIETMKNDLKLNKLPSWTMSVSKCTLL